MVRVISSRSAAVTLTVLGARFVPGGGGGGGGVCW